MAVVSNALGSLNDTHGKHIAVLSETQTFTRAQSVAPVALTSTGGSIATNASLSNIFTHTTTENTNLAAPTNLVSGTYYTWIFTQGATPRTLSLNAIFQPLVDTFAISTGAASVTALVAVYDGTNLLYTFTTANSASLNLANVFTKAQSVTPVTLTSTTNSIATDASLSNNFIHTLTENTTLANPTNKVTGTIYTWKFIQDSTPRTLAFGTDFVWPGGSALVVSTGSGAVDVITGYYDGVKINTVISGQNFS
jgi:hypothetical protein